MPVLHLENVPEGLIRQIQNLATARNVAVETESVRLLKQAVEYEQARTREVEQTSRQRAVRDVLDDITRTRMRPDPDGPTVVEMLREDRDR